MTKRFCDICDKPLNDSDDKPFIRFHKEKDVQIMLVTTNSIGGVVNDICVECKQTLALEGEVEPPKREPIATLQIPAPPSMERRPQTGAGKPFVRSQPQPKDGEEKPAKK